jgi:hypothetical protein
MTVSVAFLTDGLFDGPGGIADFQRFAFPESFHGLQSLYTKTINLSAGDIPFSFDELTVNQVPEPMGAIFIGVGGLLLALQRRLRGI